MGLDTTHDAWHGAYSAFMRWREKLMEVAGLPPLALMEGFFDKGSYRDPFVEFAKTCPNMTDAIYACLPIRWDILKPNPLYKLLNHSDCEGKIKWQDCDAIADSLENLLPVLKDAGDGGGHIGSYSEKTEQFILGLRKAAKAQENLEFH